MNEPEFFTWSDFAKTVGIAVVATAVMGLALFGAWTLGGYLAVVWASS